MFIGEGKTKFEPYIYNLKRADEVLIFASGEISNGIWDFALNEW